MKKATITVETPVLTKSNATIENPILRQSNVTSNYSQFNYLKGNRYGGSNKQGKPSNEQFVKYKKKVKELVKAMELEKYDDNFPIEIAIIAGLYYILDGQHRLAAAMELGIIIPFIVLPNIETIEQAEAYCKKKNNSKGQLWPLSDFFYSAMNSDKNPDMRPKYEYIDTLSKTYKVALGYVCDIAIGEGSTKTGGVIKQNVAFELKNDTEKILKLALKIAKNNSTRPYELMASRAFVRSVARMFRHPLFDDKFLAKVLKEKMVFESYLLNNNGHVARVLAAACNKGLHNNYISLTDKKVTIIPCN